MIDEGGLPEAVAQKLQDALDMIEAPGHDAQRQRQRLEGPSSSDSPASGAGGPADA